MVLRCETQVILMKFRFLIVSTVAHLCKIIHRLSSGRRRKGPEGLAEGLFLELGGGPRNLDLALELERQGQGQAADFGSSAVAGRACSGCS
jgi:hypothetical protein